MDPNEPTHFDLIVVGTGLTESILSAALAKAGYTVLVLSPLKNYGDQVSSLTLREISQLPSTSSASFGRCTFTLSLPEGQDAGSFLSQRFEISLCPAFVKARGEAIECAIRSRVASYLDFGLVGGIASFDREKQEWTRVPATKGDVFTNNALSLVEKRRLTKLLLKLASQEEGENETEVQETFDAYLTRAGLSAQSKRMMYAASRCTLPTEPAKRAVKRLRSYITSTGVYGPSPFLVGHYGGIGDLVAGYSRVCAVWGGGQVLGHKLGPLDRSPTIGKRVVATPLPFGPDLSTTDSAATQPPALSTTTSKALGIPVELSGESEPATILTADYVVASSCHLAGLLPELVKSVSKQVIAVQAIYILDRRPTFPSTLSTSEAGPSSEEGSDDDDPKMETKVYLLPSDTDRGIGSISLALTGSKTNSAPAGYCELSLGRWSQVYADIRFSTTDLLHALVPLIEPEPADSFDRARKIDPVLKTAIKSLEIKPLVTFTREITIEGVSRENMPENMIVVDPVSCTGKTESLSETIEECTVQAHDLFVKLVGNDVPFFAPTPRPDDDE